MISYCAIKYTLEGAANIQSETLNFDLPKTSMAASIHCKVRMFWL